MFCKSSETLIEEQVEEMFGIWSNIEYPLTETITLPASPELMPSAEWKQVRFEFTATSAKYESLLNTYPQFALLSAGSADVNWYLDDIQINLIEE